MSFSVEILSAPAPVSNRVNEDAWLLLDFPPGLIIAAVIDGAGTRLPLPPLEAMLAEQHPGLSAAAFAATTARAALIAQFTANPARPLSAALLAANDALRAAVTAATGDFSPRRILSLAGEPPHSDPRRARLALPAAVVTLARLNRVAQTLEFAHAGDTALLEIGRDGEAVRRTADQMGPFDGATLQLAARLQAERHLPRLADAVLLPEVTRLNLENGIRHNFVDETGQTRPGRGCGIIDGLPQLADYLETGVIAFDPGRIAGFCLHSDGLELPAPLDETPAQTQTRLAQTARILQKEGLHGLFKTIQTMLRADPDFNRYPRLKPQDDATGIFLRF